MSYPVQRPAIEIIIQNETGDKHYSLIFTQRQAMEIWLSNNEGEGMGMKVNRLFTIIDTFFKENH